MVVKWCEMVQNGGKWHKNDAKWCEIGGKMMKNGAKW
jgi:hypothetical protein